MKNKKIITAFLAITFSLLSLLTPLACVSAKMDQATTYQESNRKESHRKMSISGTAVPNTGYVGNVYFNTALSVEEVANIVSNVFVEDVQNYYITLNETENCIAITYQQGVYAIYSQIDDIRYIIFSTSIVPIYNIDFVGWNSSFPGFVSYNANVDFEHMWEEVYGKNDLLTSLVSITPFEEETPPTLIETIGTGIANSAALFGAVLANAFTALASVFITNNELTLLGTVLVIAIGATVVSFAIKLILRLIQKIKV